MNPKLTIVAGCNGSGKSSFSPWLSEIASKPYDYDKVFKEKYDSLIPNELQDTMAHNLSWDDFNSAINIAIKKNKDFCYETNFNSTPLHWPKKFKKANYDIDIIYFSMDSVEKAKERVRIRFENGGHFVPDNEVENRYILGFKNLNENFNYFDRIILFDTSQYNAVPKHLATIINKKIVLLENYPKYLNKLIPNISKLIEKNKP